MLNRNASGSLGGQEITNNNKINTMGTWADGQVFQPSPKLPQTFLWLERNTENIMSTSLRKFHNHLVSSNGKEPVCCVGGQRFEPRLDQHSGSLNNWGEWAAFLIISANGWMLKSSGIKTINVGPISCIFSVTWSARDIKEPGFVVWPCLIGLCFTWG